MSRVIYMCLYEVVVTWQGLWVADCGRGGAGRGDACLDPVQPSTLPVTALGLGFSVCQVW